MFFKRLLSLAFDHFLMSIGIVFISAPAFILESIYHIEYPVLKTILLSIGFTLYVNKDILGGRSLAKRAFNLYVKDTQKNLVASEVKCLLRNLFFIIWPIEILILIITKKKRLGDMLCSTVVEPLDEPSPYTPNYSTIFTTLAITFCAMYFSLSGLIPIINAIE